MSRLYARFYGLLNRIPGCEDKTELKMTLVGQASEGRTEHLTELTDNEYYHLLKDMEKLATIPKHETAQLIELRKQRRVSLILLRQLGLDTQDWNMVNKFTSSKKLSGKSFRELTAEEQVELQKKVRMILKKNAE